jgi:signal transduction histidine kinase
MARNNRLQNSIVPHVHISLWELELEKSSSRYHIVAAWVAILFDPVFAVTDYFNIPESWSHVFVLRLCVSAITLTAVILRRYIPSYFLVVIPFTLISLQNAYTYSLIGDEHLLGQNLNYMALLVGAAMFVIWDWQYSLVLLFISALATTYFLSANPTLEINQFFIKGGLLLVTTAVFMMILIRTRHDLTIKEIKARIALQLSNEEIKAQNHEIHAQGEEIRGINENLENLVRLRTAELEKKNRALEEYAFINAHKLRSPVASILGLINLLNKMPANEEAKPVLEHLQQSAEKLDEIVGSITKALQRGEKK